MELQEAIAILKAKRILFEDLKVVYRAIDTVLAELDIRYVKGYQEGYQDGFKQAKFDCEMDKLDGR